MPYNIPKDTMNYTYYIWTPWSGVIWALIKGKVENLITLFKVELNLSYVS